MKYNPQFVRRRPQLSEIVAEQLRFQIMTGAIRPGEFIRLDEAAQSFSVSVTPVREALVTLRGEGLVKLEPHRGYQASELTRQDIADIFWLQGTIAVEISGRLAETITTDQLTELTELNTALQKALDSENTSEIVYAEFSFHREHNLMVKAHKLSWFLLTATRYTPDELYAKDPQWGVEAVRSHSQLIAAYQSRDVEAAKCFTRNQFDDGAARLTKHLEAAGIWDNPIS